MLDYESSLGESGQLPEWFATVLEKEYEKNKKVFDVHAKKVYKMQAMAEVPINNID